MQWVEVTIRTNTMGAELMSQVLLDEGITGTSIEDHHDVEQYRRKSDEWDYVDENIFADHGDEVYVKGYIAMEAEVYGRVGRIMNRVADLVDMMEEQGVDVGRGEVLVSMVADEDWEENWKQYYKPFDVGARLSVTPCWEPYDAGERVLVQLEPGAAFGTGQHETTLMCLELCQLYAKPEAKVLDVGCGTGILGIAAVALGAAHALEVDRDEVAVHAAQHNAQLNDLSERVTCMEGNLADAVKGKYDLIFANIVADAVIALLPAAKKLMARGATLIASGIILDRETDVIEAVKHCGLRVADRRNRGEWIALAIQK